MSSPPMSDLHTARKLELLAQRLKQKGLSVPQELSIQRRTPSASAPLSLAQERLWFLNEFAPGSAAYNIPVAVRLSGQLDVAALERALNVVVQRHESLRTRFAVQNGAPVQIIRDDCQVSLPVLQVGTGAASEDQIQRLIAQHAQQPFDLCHDVLIRCALLRCHSDEHVLIVCVHHIVADGWSLGVFVRELVLCYDAFTAARAVQLPELPIQYADYAHWQRQNVNSLALLEQLNYWKQHLQGELPVLELPLDRPRPAVQTFHGTKHPFVVNEQLTNSLRALSRQNGATLFMTLLAAYDVLLHRYSGQHNILVGTPIANRSRSECEGLIGLFVNSVVLCADLSDDPSFQILLQRVRNDCLEAYRHQDVPFEKLVEALNPQRGLSQSPLFQTMLVLDNAPMPALKLPDLMAGILDIDSATAKFDLLVELREQDGGLAGWFEYNNDLFDAATIGRVAGHFEVLLQRLVADPEQPISQLALLSQVEHYQMVQQWNATEYVTTSACVHELFDTQAFRTPLATAVVHGDVSLTYSELWQRANQLAHKLQRLGIQPDMPVAVFMQPSVEMVVSVLAVLKAGGMYVALDPAYPPERLRLMLADARPHVVLTQPMQRDQLPGQAAQVIVLDATLAAVADESAATPPTRAGLDHLVYTIYTSGSTGRPKGVVLSHRSLGNLLQWQLDAFAKPAPARTLQFASLSFDVSFQEIFSTWCSGGTLVLIGNEQRRDPQALLAVLSNERIERLFLPFVALQHIAEAVDLLRIMPHDLREVITAGEQLQITPQITRLFAALPACVLRNQYGPSETHVVTEYSLSGSSDTWPAFPAIGRPIANTQMYILDHRLRPVPIGVAGELFIGGVGVGRAYLNRPDATAEKFIPDPFSFMPGRRLYRTGDLARYHPDGSIQFLGRHDHQVKVRGFRIELGEIEAVLGSHPAVQQAVVVARDTANGGGKQLCAYVVPSPSTVAGTELRTFLKERLPEYMLPAVILELSALPLTPSGKIDRRALPAPANALVSTNAVAPQTPLEHTLAAMWSDLLGVPVPSRNDNFFDLGGHSLAVTRLVYRLRDLLQVELPLRVLFEAPTVAGLATAIEHALESHAVLDGAQPIDLANEVTLDQSIVPPSAKHRAIARHILLTGATGFVGAFLLNELLQTTTAAIHCLVRAEDEVAAMERIRATLTKYELWHEHFCNRIVPVVGDLAAPRLGVSESCWTALAHDVDVIYHNGALVNYMYPYAALKAPNVGGTVEVLRLAATITIKQVHFVSTTGVLDGTGRAGAAPIRENDPLDHTAGLLLGYAQSKWVAEKIVMLARERGFPVSIYRLGRVSGHTGTGACQTDDFLWRMIKTCIQIGRAPEIDLPINLTPVDYIARAVVHLAQQPSSIGHVFHFTNHAPLPWTDMVRWMQNEGYHVDLLDPDDWRQAVLHTATQAQTIAGYELLPLLFGNAMPTSRLALQLDDSNTATGLMETSIHCAPVNGELLNLYFKYYRHQDFLPAPSTDRMHRASR